MNRETKLFRLLLSKHGYFLTKPRKLIFKVLQDHNTLTISELIKSTPGHDQATIYRNIELFEKLGIVNKIQLGWKTKLELSDIFHHHHHHLACISCNKVIVLPEDLVIEQEIARLSYTRRFKAIDHQLEIRGVCLGCQKAAVQ